MTQAMKSLMVTAAVSGLLGGSATMFAAPAPAAGGQNTITAAGAAAVSTVLMADKHACKGANSCKGQGGCKSGDNGCKGKNSCKGKGGCATDGSKMPS